MPTRGLLFDFGVREGGATKGMTVLADAMAKAADSAESFSLAGKGATKTSAALRVATLDAAKAQAVWDSAATDSSASVARLAGAQSALVRSQQRLAAAQKASSTSLLLSKKAVSAGSTLTRKLTLPIIAVGAVSAKMASDFNASMTKIQTQAGGSARDVKTLSAAVLSLSKTAEQGPNQLADSLYHLKSVGLANVPAMKALKQASDLAAVGGANLEDTTNALAGAWRTGIKGATNMHEAVATLNAIIGSGNMRMDQLNAAIGTGILPTAKTFGLSLKDVGAALALFTDEGVPADEAATRLRMTFSLLGAPSGKAQKALTAVGLTAGQAKTSVGAMSSLLAKAGVTTNALASDMRKPDGLLVAVRDLKRHLDEAHVPLTTQAALLSKAFGGGKSSSTIMSLINNVGVLGQKYAQQAKLMKQYDAAVAAQRDTPAAKLAIAESNLKRAAIIAGDSVLPIFTKLVGEVGGLGQAFGDLSGSNQKLVLWSAGALAALGPVLNLGGRLMQVGRSLGAASGFIGTKLATLSGASEATAMRVGIAMRGVSAAIGGAAIGTAVGTLTRNASTTVKAFGIISSAAAGAAIGAGTGGPWGAAIGGISGGLSAIVSGLGDTGAAAAQARAVYVANMKQQIASTEQLAASLQGVYNLQSQAARQQAVGALTKGQVDLHGKSVLQYFTNGFYGLSSSDLLQAAMTGSMKGLDAKSPTLARLAHANDYGGPTSDYKTLMDVLKSIHDELTDVSDDNVLVAQAQGKNILTTKQLGTSYAKLSALLKGNALGGRYSTEVVKENLAALDKQADAQAKSGVAITTVNRRYDDQVATLRASLLQLGLQPPAIQKLVAAYGKVPTSVTTALNKVGVTPSEIQAIISKYGDIPTSLLTQVTKKGVTPAQIQAILDKYGLIPARKDTDVRLTHSGDSTSWLSTYFATLQAYASGHPVKVPVTHVAGNVTTLIPNMSTKKGRATGGVIRGPGGPTEDKAGLFALSNREFVSTASSYGRNAAALEAGNRGAHLVVAGFASGGVVHSGRDWLFRGHRYASERAAVNARASYARQHQSDLVLGVDTKIGDIGQAYSPRFSVADVGIKRIDAQIAAARAKLAAAVRDGLGKHAADELRKQINSAAALARHQLSALRLKIRTSDLNAIKKALGGSADDIRSAIAQAAADMKAAGVSAQKIKTLTTTGAQLANAQNTLVNMKSYSAGISSTLAGSFDSTKYGSVSDLLQGFGAATGTNTKYAGELNKLRGEAKGNKALTAYLNQLAASGDTTTLDTLAGASKSQLAQVSKAVGSYNKSLSAGANAATVTKYGKSIEQQTKNMDRIEKRVDDLIDHSDRVLHTVGALAQAVARHAESSNPRTRKAIEAALTELVAVHRHGRRHG